MLFKGHIKLHWSDIYKMNDITELVIDFIKEKKVRVFFETMQNNAAFNKLAKGCI